VPEDVPYTSSPENLEAELEKSRASAARLLENLAEKLRTGPVVRQATDRIGRAAHYVQDSSMKDMAGRVKRLVRERPALAILVAAAAGFLAVRALRRR
jgi:ElaB/YqjD/DUF883 family membrane-anchored ribosome-binding protein